MNVVTNDQFGALPRVKLSTLALPPMERCDVAFRLGRSYSPETISVMTAAFDMVCKSVSTRMKGRDDVKKTLALIILRQVDQGECNAERLAETAFREWTGTDRSAIGDRLARTG